MQPTGSEATPLEDLGDLPESGIEYLDVWEPSAEEIRQVNADTDALAEHLRSLGFEGSMAPDEFGIRNIDFDESTYDVIFDAMEDFHRAQLAEEIATWSALAAGCVPQDLAGLRHADRSQLGDLASERVARQRVEVVEGGDALGRYSVILWRQLQLRDHTAPSPGQSGHDD